MTLDLNALVDSGIVSSVDQLATAYTSTSGSDRGHPQRAIDIRVIGGVDLRVLPDRGLDISGAWYRGLPLAWRSRVGEVSRLVNPRGSEWIQAFGGGLLATCGLRNVGAASEGHGLHGTFAHLPARDVRVDHLREGNDVGIQVTGVIEDMDALETHLRCERTIRTMCARGDVLVRDVVTNLGPATAAAPMLYHSNFGAPVWQPGACLELPSREVIPRDDATRSAGALWREAPEPEEAGIERVYEHLLVPADGWPTARIVNESLGVTVEMSWDARAMPRLHQWVHPCAGVYVLGIEPANCSVGGRAADREERRLPVLEPSARRTSSVRWRIHDDR